MERIKELAKKVAYYSKVGVALFVFVTGIGLYCTGCGIRAAGHWLMNVAIALCPDMVEKYQ